MRIHSLLGACLLLGALLAATPAAAQTMTIRVGAAAGTGLEIAGGGASTLRRSPVFVTINGGVLLDNDQRFEIGAALHLELEGRVGVGIEPQLRINAQRKRLRLYLMCGLPIFFAPYTLFGFSVGPGLAVRLSGGIEVFGELPLRAYPFGNDLPDGVALFHADLALGVRYAF